MLEIHEQTSHNMNFTICFNISNTIIKSSLPKAISQKKIKLKKNEENIQTS